MRLDSEWEVSCSDNFVLGFYILSEDPFSEILLSVKNHRFKHLVNDK